MLREYLLGLSLIEYTIIHSAPLQEMCGARKVPVLSLSREVKQALFFISKTLGIGLAQAGRKVLLIDGDPQGSLTISLGHPQPDKLPFTLSDAMGRILMDEPLRPGEGILHHPEGVDLMPADIQLSGMEVSLVNAMSRRPARSM